MSTAPPPYSADSTAPPAGRRKSMFAKLADRIGGNSSSSNPSAAPAVAPPTPSPTPGSRANILTRKLSLSSSSSNNEDPLTVLTKYDTVILVDDSGSMQGGRWQSAKSALVDVAELARRYDQDGLDVLFLNDPTRGQNLTSAIHVEALFNQVRPSGSTPLGMALETILNEYMTALEASVAGNLGVSDTVKPLNLIVITDGAPTDDPEDVIVAVARRLDRGNFPLSQVGIQMLQIGNDSGASRFLQELDDALSTKYQIRDIVDTVPYQGDMTGDLIVKTMLGGINRRMDRKANEVPRSKTTSGQISNSTVYFAKQSF